MAQSLSEQDYVAVTGFKPAPSAPCSRRSRVSPAKTKALTETLYHSLIHARALVKIVLSKFAQLLGQKGQDLTQSAWFRAAVPSQLGAEAHGLGDRTGRAHR